MTIGSTSSPWAVDSAQAFTNRNLAETAGKSNAAVDMNGFLRLLTAQMQHQDPFAPMDNNQMVAQMAQFSSLSSQIESNTLLSNISDAVSGGRLSDAANWIGKSMLVESNIATPDRSGSYAGELNLSSAANDVQVNFINGDGAIVHTLDLGARPAGAAPFFWDGHDAAGTFVGGDALKIQVRGATPTNVATWASIAAVQSPASGTNAQLITALGNYSPADALRLG